MQSVTVQKWLWGRGFPILRMGSAIFAGGLFFLGLCANSVAFSQIDEPPLDRFSPNPLEMTVPDPLLPQPPAIGEILDAATSQQLAEELDRLNLEATVKLQASDTPGAFAIWNRELRLRRYLGRAAEIKALTRVGKIAWNNSQRLQLQFITKRLQVIQQELLSESPLDLGLIQSLGFAFQEVRAKQPAIEVYQKILEDARSRQDIFAEAETLKILAKIHQDWLNYKKAAIVYEELAALMQEHRDLFPNHSSTVTPRPSPTPRPASAGSGSETGLAVAPVTPPTEADSLKQLAYSYEQGKQPLQAIAARERLIALYMNQQNYYGVPPLQIAIATDYESLGQLNLASQYYQEAYTSAVAIQQFAVASEALDKLASLYRTQKQLEAALKIYQVKVTVEQQAYNSYGLMNTYDELGQVYVELKAYKQALDAYQRGLEVARLLKHRVEYFANKIQKVNRQMGRGSS